MTMACVVSFAEACASRSLQLGKPDRLHERGAPARCIPPTHSRQTLARARLWRSPKPGLGMGWGPGDSEIVLSEAVLVRASVIEVLDIIWIEHDYEGSSTITSTRTSTMN